MKTPRSWKSVLGDFRFEDKAVQFLGGEYKGDQEHAQPNVGYAICDLYFGGGAIEVEVEFTHEEQDQSGVIVISRNPINSACLVAGIDYRRYVLKVFKGFKGSGDGWETLEATGDVRFEVGKPQKLRVEQRGSLIKLFVDGIEIIRHQLNFTLPRNQCGVLCRSAHTMFFRDLSVVELPRRAFVVMQFGDPFDKLYTEVLKPVASSLEYEPVRADETYGPGVILNDIVRQIIDADIIIADITPKNENVFYEIGYAHAMNKPTILLAQRGKTLPFDVSGFRVLFYDDTIAGKSVLEKGLRHHIESIRTSQAL